MRNVITLSQFAEMLSNILKSTFLQAVSVTEPKLNKKDRETKAPLPFKTVLHSRNINLQLGYNLDKQVTDRATKEGIEDADFEAQEHKWARRVKGQLARHKAYEIAEDMAVADMDTTKLYMPYVVVRIDENKYIGDGKEIAKAVIEPFFPPASDYENQPQENKVRVQYMKLSSVKWFKLNGVEYHIV